MSTGLECLFFQHGDMTYYLLQDGGCPVDAWDWREYATCYGPFKDFDAARKHLCDTKPNPGGYSRLQGNTDDGLLIQLAEDCETPACRFCGHDADDRPAGSFDIMEFRQHGWTTYGHVKGHGLCVPCYTSLKAAGEIE